jgi:type IX secretion system PorP/SprF family membrane protein
MKKIIAIIAVILPMVVSAQQEGMINQIAFNKLTINPGYTGYRERGIINIAHRQQWTGFKGAPMTSLISFDTPLSTKEFAVGGAFINNKIGPVSKMELASYFSYRLKLNNKSTISWGLSAGAQLYQVNLTDLQSYSDIVGVQDDALLTNTKGYFTPNFGFGVFYSNNDYYAGVSIPKLLSIQAVSKDNAPMQNFKQNSFRTIYLNGGYLHKISSDMLLTYNLAMLSSINSPLTLGAYATCILQKNYTFGAYYYVAQSAGLMFQMQMENQFSFGYALEFATNSLFRTNYGTHELSLKYALNSKVKRITSAKYF